MRVVFLDTVGLIALWDATDQWQAAADAAMASLSTPGVRLVTSSSVLLECGNAAARKSYRSDVCHLRDSLQRQGNLITPTEDDIRQAWSAYRLGPPGSAGIVDHISFALLRRLAITDVFTNDRHFQSAGFHTLF